MVRPAGFSIPPWIAVYGRGLCLQILLTLRHPPCGNPLRAVELKTLGGFLFFRRFHVKQNKGFAILPLALLVAALGLASQGALKVSKAGPTLNKPAVSAAFKAGKSEHWKNLNK